jgi:hypothetical protein
MATANGTPMEMAEGTGMEMVKGTLFNDFWTSWTLDSLWTAACI